EEENQLIPDFYEPINEFMSRLRHYKLVRALPAPVGEHEVLPPPKTGMRPVAAIGRGTPGGSGARYPGDGEARQDGCAHDSAGCPQPGDERVGLALSNRCPIRQTA